MLNNQLNIKLLDNGEKFVSAHNRELYFPNYLISNRGRLYSLNTRYVLSKRVEKTGYIRYRLSLNGKLHYVQAQRLVASAFVKNPNPKQFNTVNHIDEDPLNNDFRNLEWCNDKYNLNHGTAQQRRAIKRSKKTQQLDKSGNLVAEFISLNDASRKLNLSLTLLWESCKNGNLFNGYYWRYADTQSEVKKCLTLKI